MINLLHHAVMARIEDSTRIIGEIIMEVSRDVFVAEAASELSGQLLSA